MCIAAPGKVIKIDGKKAIIEYKEMGETRLALIGDEDVKVGDYVLVQMGIIIQRISSKDAAVAENVWK